MPSPRVDGNVPQPSEWQPHTEVAEEDWQPQTERTPVREHTRSPKKRRGAAGFLPAAGGMVGGIVGKAAGVPAVPFVGPAGPIGGGILGAGVGGAAGEAAAQLIEGQGPNVVLGFPGLDPGRIGAQFGLQAGSEAAGLGVGKLAQIGGRPLMQWAIKSTPEVAQVAIREGIVGTRKGLQKILTKIGESADKTRQVIMTATRRGSQFQSADIAVEIGRQLIPDIAGQAQVSPDMRKLQQLSGQFLADHPGMIPASHLQEIKQSSDAIAGPIYALILKKKPVTAVQLLKYRWHKALADHARELLESIPGVQQSNARTAELIRVKEALEPVVRKAPTLGARLAGRTAGPAAGAAIGAALPGDYSERTRRGLEGAVLGGIATSPVALSYLAQGFNNPLLLALLRQSPRALTSQSGNQ